jgi:hypothetical protein
MTAYSIYSQLLSIAGRRPYTRNPRTHLTWQLMQHTFLTVCYIYEDKVITHWLDSIYAVLDLA